MSQESRSNVLLRTKLHRPQLPADHVPRADLLARLAQDGHHPAVLVSAPAGYGKSTLVSSWLARCGKSWCWVSLNEEDNDLHSFLSCFVAAVENATPNATSETKALLAAPNLPPTAVLTTTLVNELDLIQPELIIVLDDIHCLRDQGVLQFLALILRQPSPTLQIVMVGRRDPVLPVASLRAKGMLTEIRMRDLRFSEEETGSFLKAATGQPIDETTAAQLVQKTEGWVTGLRLATLAMQGNDASSQMVRDLKGTTPFVVDFLVSEVLDHQPASVRNLLLATSVLGRFSAPLCDALYGLAPLDGPRDTDGQAFIDWLQSHNLFVISLDNENLWFRYHHLFGELLENQLQRQAKPEEITALRARASRWCEEQGQVEEAIKLALEAQDPEAAADIVERNRDLEYDEDRWYIVDRWLNLLPQEIKQQRPRLLLTQARVLNDRFRLSEIPPLIAQAQTLLETEGGADLDLGELNYFQGFIQFWVGDGPAGQQYLKRALELIPEGHQGYLRAQIELFVGLTEHISGNEDQAIDYLQNWMKNRGLGTGLVWERLQFGLGTLNILNGALAAAARESRLLLNDGLRTGRAFIHTWGEYLVGVTAFHSLDIPRVQQHFGQVIDHKYAANTRAAVDAMAGLAIIAQLDGRSDDVAPLLEQAHDHARWAGDSELDEVVRTCETRIALIRGDVATADRWLRGFELPAHVPGMIFFVTNPCITECRVLTALSTEASLKEAEGKLRNLRLEMERIRYTNQLIDVMSLQVMVKEGQGLRGQALDLLQEVLELAAPKGWLRPFIELGRPMAKLLKELKESGQSADLAASVLRAFPQSPRPTASVPPLVEPLSHRELDVLELLSRRLQNKEIADKLSISPVTVKSHLRTIYQKLAVANRREAVAMASKLRLID